MVTARLHLICGNCGCNDQFEFDLHPDAQDNGDGTFTNDVEITCCNCQTLHWLSDNARENGDT